MESWDEMNYGLPDWMFAAFAIAGWELTELMVRRYHFLWFRWFGYAVIGICVLVLSVRYVIRYVKRPKNQETEDPDAWKNY